MMRAASRLVVWAVLFATAGAAGAAMPFRFCAPGYPGTTEQAGPTMEQFARAVEAAANVPAGSIEASYHETEEGALEAVESSAGGIAIVTLPFWLAHRERLDLRPILLAVPEAGAEERWSLVAGAGRVAGPSDLSGWEVASIAGYAPDFVRGPALATWGRLPDDASVLFTGRVLSALRRAARGDSVAVVLDGAQTDGLEKLPFASELEIVATSDPMPSTIVCTIGNGESADGSERWVEALTSLDDPETLDALRLEGFRAIPDGALDGPAEAFTSAAGER